MSIDLSGLSDETILGSQPEPMETEGVSKALSILDRADRKKVAAAYGSPALSLKATRQVGTVKNTTSPTSGGSFQKKIPSFGTPVIKESSMAKKLKIAVALGGEELARMRSTVVNRAETRAKADQLFVSAPESRSTDRKMMFDLFIQAAAAETMAPGLQKQASVQPSITSHVDAFFEKAASSEQIDEAQRRFPELLQVRR